MAPSEVQLYGHYQLRTTGEPIFVLAADTAGKFLCRRPIQTRDGLQHVQEAYHAEELESASEANRREIDLMWEREMYVAGKQKPAVELAKPAPVKPN